MNILYLGHYRENTKLGESSKRFISGLCLNKNNNLTIRPIYIHQDNTQSNNSYMDLERKTCNHYDCVIQHTLPIMLSYNKNFGKNIAVVDLHTLNIKHSSYINYLNLMDKVYVRSNYSLKAITDLDTTTSIIHEPFDALNVPNHKPQKTYKFLAQGTLESRYNIKKIIRAFITEFDKEHDVQLILNVIADNAKISNLLSNIIHQLRAKHGIDNKIVVFNNKLTPQQEQELFTTVDCSINLDKADSNAEFTLKSLCHKKPVITQKDSASCDFVDDSSGFIVDSFLTNIDFLDSYDNSIHTVYEQWYDVKIDSIRETMRKAFLSNDNKQNNINTQQFSYQHFNEIIKL